MSKKKKIAIILIIIGIFGVVGGAGVFNTRSNTQPRTVVERFYGSWMTALDSSISPIERKLHMKSTYVTAAFGRSVAQLHERGRDGVLCVGAVPTDFLVGDAVVNRDGERATVTFTADGVTGYVLLVHDSRGWWRIDEVDCPAVPPVEPRSSAFDEPARGSGVR